ncbi:hypothetical protein FHS72_001567 [Loktanella ponticola]|uniref:PEP-CTERM sorting domain-containing protein n=1 Tax=Yoonia ponticola TaxID=1524255 RepID=A0A7W9EXQ2_9RHOB|nr:hypothetical protein [Yoonia ponticola]MBB5721943.1 hypothetical protein [Yoonia ponticola]
MSGRAKASRIGNAVLAISASLLLCFAPTDQAVAAQIELDDILEIDALGYRCIPSAYFEDGEDGSAAIAFSLSGKTRLPRTCLPDPCARALSRPELSQITGTEPILARFHEEWEDYYSRYADHCRSEIVVSRPRSKDTTTRAFWPPIIDRARIIQSTGIPTSSRLRPYIVNKVGIPTSQQFAPETVAYLIPPAAGRPLPVTDRPIPSPVPVPASGLLFGSLLAIIGLQKRYSLTARFRRSRKHNCKM